MKSVPGNDDGLFLNQLLPYSADIGYYNLDGRTQIARSLWTPQAGQRTKILITDGQSTSANHDATPYTPTSPLVHNVCLLNGAMYQAKDPLLGCTGTDGSYQCLLGQQLIDGNFCDRVILVPIAVGSTGVIAHAPGSGGVAFHRLGVIAKRLAMAGLTPDALLWQQGEGDTVAGTTQTAYANALSSIITAYRSYWPSLKVFISQTSWINGVTSSAVRAAQASLVDTGNNIFAGPDTDTLDATNRKPDNTHFNFTGQIANASGWNTAIQAHL